MPKLAIKPSLGVAKLLKQRREELGLSLREVEEQTRAWGRPIHFTTIAKVERGKLDPGIPRLHLLLRLYHLPFRLAEDLLDLEEFAAELPRKAEFDALYEEGLKHWQAGNLREALAHVFAIRRHIPKDAASREERQKALLFFATAAGALGKYRVSREIVDGLLLEPPVDNLLVRVLVQAAVCWDRLGSGDVALGLLARAEARLDAADHESAAWLTHKQASTFASLGEFEKAEEALQKALAEYRAAGDAYGECLAMGVMVNIRFNQSDLPGALAAARAGREHAEMHKFERPRILRLIDEGRVLLALGELDSAFSALNEALAGTLTTKDAVAQFYAHYYLCEAYEAAGDKERAKLELQAAVYHVKFVDATIPEAEEVRKRSEPKKLRRRVLQRNHKGRAPA